MGLRALGVEKGDRVALLSENRPEWAYVDLATLCAAAVDVPIYPNLMPAQVLYVLNDSQAKVAFASTRGPGEEAGRGARQGPAPQARHPLRRPARTRARSPSTRCARGAGGAGRGSGRGEAARGGGDARRPGHPHLHLGHHRRPQGRDAHPRQHRVERPRGAWPPSATSGPADVALSFLPLCHIFERMGGHYLLLQQGVTIAYAESVEKVPANMAEVRPTIMLSVPRLYEKMYARVNEKVAADSALKQRIFRWALGVGRRRLPGPGRAPHARRPAPRPARPGRPPRLREDPRADGRTAAPLRLRRARPSRARSRSSSAPSGLLILEGYGLTETSPVIAVNRPDKMKPGTWARPSGRRGEDRGGRRDPDPRAARHEGLLQQAGGDGGGDRRGPLVPHRRHRASSTPRASSSSPTARRTSS